VQAAQDISEGMEKPVFEFLGVAGIAISMLA
jgi:hypothetical protein